MRNDVAFCGAPPVESTGCRICTFGTARKDHAGKVQELFEAVHFTIVAPSQSALDLWLARSALPFETAVVHPHVAMTFKRKRVRHAAEGSDVPLRVGFCGYPTFLKGWFVFRSLVDAARTARQPFEFYHLSDRASADLRVRVVPVNGQAPCEVGASVICALAVIL